MAEIRTFETGATRNLDDNKYDYEAFFSPLVLRRRAQFMHEHRTQADGTIRDGDNWKKGIPLKEYAKSEWRHHQEFWLLHQGFEAIDEKGRPVDMENAICALMFNLEGYLHEHLKEKRSQSEQILSDAENAGRAERDRARNLFVDIYKGTE